MIKPLTNLPNYGTKTDEITIYAGPCSVESEEQFFEVAECIADLGLSWIRGGAFKPRTSPYSAPILIPSRAWAKKASRS